ncbi:MAG: FxsA family protein [Pseudomonadota bacterium]
MPFALLFLVIVFVEIAGFVAVAEATGLLTVFMLILAGIFVGAFTIRTVGVASVMRMQERSRAGEPVGQELGGLVLGFLGGLLLILPGFLTDVVGLALLVKPIQMLIWPRYGRHVANRMPNMGRAQVWTSPGTMRPGQPRSEQPNPGQPNGGQPNRHGDVVIDADPVVQDDDTAQSRDKNSSNPWGA